MSFDEAPRPRSTPLPDPGGPASPPPPPSFSAPSASNGGATPPPPPPQGPPTVPLPLQAQQPPPTAVTMTAAGRNISPVWIVAVVTALVLVGVGVFFAVRSSNEVDDASDQTDDITIPTFTIPEITVQEVTVPKVDAITVPEITVPEITVPKITVPQGVPPVTLPELTIPTSSISKITIPTITIPKITLPPGVTLPPGITLPTIPVLTPGGLSNGATSIFDPAATAAVVADLETSLPGDPTAFTTIVLYPDYAIASAQDPNDPGTATGAIWRAGQVLGGVGIPAIGDGQPFSTADVDWGAVAGVVAQAPQLLGDPTAEVTHVIVQRWVFDADRPVRVLVYAGFGYVEAAADGTVVATH